MSKCFDPLLTSVVLLHVKNVLKLGFTNNLRIVAVCNNEGNKNEHPPIGWQTKRCHFTRNDEKRVVESLAVVRRKKGIIICITEAISL